MQLVSRALIGLLIGILGAIWMPARALAQPEPAAAAAKGNSEAHLINAKVAFRQGNLLRAKGDFEGALVFYLRSRSLVASVGNTLNAAVCLDELKRYDEAYELFAEALTRFDERLSNEQRTTIARYLDRLRQRLAVVEVRANVTGLVVIDGRPRGTLPLAYGLRVVAGSHTISIIKEGYETFRTTVIADTKAAAQIDAKLKVLTKLGRMQVANKSLNGAELYVDGALIGRIPWEGALKPGQHRIRLEHDTMGTAPQQVNIVEGRTVTVKLAPVPLGAALRLSVEPAAANLYVDDVAVGRGGWSGRLPLGEHVLRADQPGYRSAKSTFEVVRDSDSTQRLSLARDPEHPIWDSDGGDSGVVWLALHGALALTPSLNSGTETSCKQLTCTANGLALGGMAGLRFGYALPIGLSIYLDAGYLGLRKRVRRELLDGAARFLLRDRLRINGGYLAAGLGVRLPLSETFDLAAGAMVGAMFQHSYSLVDGDVSQDGVAGKSAPVVMLGPDKGLNSTNLLVRPEVGVGVNLGAWRVGLNLAAAILALDGPNYPVEAGSSQRGILRMRDTNCNANADVVCVAATDKVSGEQAYGATLVWLPSLEVAVAFE